MTNEEKLEKPTHISKFMSRVTRGIRTRSPSAGKVASTDSKERKMKGKEDNEVSFKIPHPPPPAPTNTPKSPFGTLVNRLSFRKKKEHVINRDDINRSDSNENVNRVLNSTHSTPRPAVSETDLRNVTVRRGVINKSKGSTLRSVVGTDDRLNLQIKANSISSNLTPDMPTPLAGVSQFMSEDNLASADCGTPARRVPSYVKISCTLNGYRSPRRATEFDSPLRPPAPLGKSLIQMRLQQLQNSNIGGSRYVSTGTDSPSPSTSTSRSNEMGNTCSSPGIKSLIGQFDRLNLCTEKYDSENEKENVKPIASVVTEQPVALNNKVHPMKDDSQKVDPIKENEKLEQELEKKLEPQSEEIAAESETEIVKPNPEVVNSSEEKKADEKPTPPQKPAFLENLASEAESESEKEATMGGESKPESSRSGESFRGILNSTRLVLEAKCEKALEELNTIENLPEAAADDIRMASGKAHLLIKKKLSKFEELVQKNLNPIPGDLQPATVDDLEGYWSLVDIELKDINNCFDKIESWRTNDWKICSESSSSSASPTPEANNNEKSVPKKAKPALPAKPVISDEKKKERDEQRRALLAAAKARAKEQKEKQSSDGMLVF